MKTFMLLITMTLFTMPVLAETYIWEDAQGTVNFADELGKVPKKYRKKARIVGEEETPPAEAKEGKGKPAPQQQTQGNRERVPGAKPDGKLVYGGKDAAAWKAEFSAISMDLKAAEKQLVDYRNRLKNSSGMSRSEYLGIQSTVKTIELSVLEQRKKQNELKLEAEKAGVPADLME